MNRGMLLVGILVGNIVAMDRSLPPKVRCTGLTSQDVSILRDLADQCLVLLVARSDGYEVNESLLDLQRKWYCLCDEYCQKLGHDLLREEIDLWYYKLKQSLGLFFRRKIKRMVVPEIKLGLLVIVPECEVDWELVNERVRQL